MTTRQLCTVILLSLCSAACHESPSAIVAPAAHLRIISGDNQTLVVNEHVQPLTIEVRDGLARVVANAPVTWRVFTSGSGAAATTLTTTTDAAGLTSITPQLPTRPGTLLLAEATSGPADTARFHATGRIGAAATGRFSPTSADMVPLGSHTFAVQFFDAFGNEVTDGTTAFSSEDPRVAGIGSDGRVEALRVGTTAVLAKRGAATARAPIKVGLLRFASVKTGPDVSCGITDTHDVYCWGLFDGQANIGPTRLSTDMKFTDLASTTCGYGTDTQVYCWSRVLDTQLTRIETTQRFIGFGVTADGRNGCGVTVVHEAYCWGDNESGQIGNGHTSATTQPATLVRVNYRFTSIGVGRGFTCALTDLGAVYCWGLNDVGQLGAGRGLGSSFVPLRIDEVTNFRSLSVGVDYACGVTTTNAAYCWGSNEFHQLGSTGGTESCARVISCSFHPLPVAGGISFQSVSAGYLHTCGISITGYAYCWGSNYRGELGIGPQDLVTGRATPSLVVGGLLFTSITVSNATTNTNGHTCAMTAQSFAYCWGVGTSGQTSGSSSSTYPLPVLGQEP